MTLTDYSLRVTHMIHAPPPLVKHTTIPTPVSVLSCLIPDTMLIHSLSDGSYYYSNGNNSTYYNNGQGGSTYTAPNGNSYKK
jgi:hypothetical protein